MADINVERKSGMGWLWWILGLIVLALLLWWFFAGDDEAEVAEVADPAAVVQPAEPVAGGATGAGAASPGIAEVLASPSDYYGQSFTLESVRAAQVIGDRSFWVEGAGGERLLVVKNESPREGVADVQGQADMRPARNVNAGETLRIDGTLQDASRLDNVQPPLDAQTRQALQGQQIFLQANVADIQHQ